TGRAVPARLPRCWQKPRQIAQTKQVQLKVRMPMSDAFISYARSSVSYARTVAEMLRSVGYSVWMDDELPAHRNFTRVIEEQLDAASAVLVIWSADAAESDWVMSEAERARGAHKLVQIRVDDTRLPMPFDQIQCADLRDWTDDPDAAAWTGVLRGIADLVEPGASDSPAKRKRNAAETGPLLAILAFENLSDDPEMVYFSDGLSEEIQQTVSQGTDLRVIGRASSFQFRGAEKAASNVASKLGATHVLDGAVRRSNNRVRISAQLVACAVETTLWSDRFEGDLTDVFALQDEIAAAVASALRREFDGDSRSALDTLTYDLYLKAKALQPKSMNLTDRVQANLARIAMLEEVVSSAPDFSPALAALALCRAQSLRTFGRSHFPAVTLDSVVDTARSALELDSGLGVAYQALSWVEPSSSYGARESLQRQALAVAPNDADVLHSMAEFCHSVGFMRERLRFVERAWRLDPVSYAVSYAKALDHLGRYDEAVNLWNQVLAEHPDEESTMQGAINAAAATADWERLDMLVNSAIDKGMDSDVFWTYVNHNRNLRTLEPEYAARHIRVGKEALAQYGTFPLSYPCSLARMGLADEAFEMLEVASFDKMLDFTLFEGVDGAIFRHENRALTLDRRFVSLCAKLGLCAYWFSAGRWPDCADQVPYDFRTEARRLMT
ncbi:MAG: TIR domain-containing protein, partial [Pseudomonadales bacterium]